MSPAFAATFVPGLSTVPRAERVNRSRCHVQDRCAKGVHQPLLVEAYLDAGAKGRVLRDQSAHPFASLRKLLAKRNMPTFWEGQGIEVAHSEFRMTRNMEMALSR